MNSSFLVLGLGLALANAGCHPRSSSHTAAAKTDVAASQYEANRALAAQKAKNWYSNKSCAVSCHTSVPFMMADPLTNPDSLAVANGMKALVDARVAGWSSVMPFYPSKRAQSLATEAVANAVVLLQYDMKTGQKINSSTCRALTTMYSLQTSADADGSGDVGSWPWLDYGLVPFENKEATAWGASLAYGTLGLASSSLEPEKNCPEGVALATGRTALSTYLQSSFAKVMKFQQLSILYADLQWGQSIVSSDNRSSLLRDVARLQRSDGGFRLVDLGVASATGFNYQSDAYATALVAMILMEASDVQEYADVLSKARCWLESTGADSAAIYPSLNYLGTGMPNTEYWTDANRAQWLLYAETVKARHQSAASCGRSLPTSIPGTSAAAAAASSLN